MGLVIGIIIAVLTLPVAWVALMAGSNWETGQGGSSRSGLVTLAVGWAIAGTIIVSHYHPVHIGW